jgi:membrane-bound metal-dependent hydrolase YbcI (DUF457 family)
MDVLYHGVVGFTVAKVIGSPDVLPAAVAAMVPDIIGSIPFLYFKLLKAPKKSFFACIRSFWRTANSNTFDNKIDRGIYQFFHSFTALPVVALVSFLLYPASWLVLTVAYAAHILIDIPTHDGDFATQFLYPISAVRYEGKNWAKHQKEFLLFWAALITILFAFRVL